MPSERLLERYLGWFSVGLGVAQLAATSLVAKLIGIQGGGKSAMLPRAVGARVGGRQGNTLVSPARELAVVAGGGRAGRSAC